jgi:hypothetical protein
MGNSIALEATREQITEANAQKSFFAPAGLASRMHSGLAKLRKLLH